MGRQSKPEPNRRKRINLSSPVRFGLWFGIIASVSYGVTTTSVFRNTVYPWLLHQLASYSGTVLRFLGEDIPRVTGAVITSDRISLEISRGCDALEPFILFAAAVVAFPTSLRAKIWGVVGGFIVLHLADLLRILALYYIGIHLPNLFHFAHVDFGQAIFVLFTISLWVAWASRFAK